MYKFDPVAIDLVFVKTIVELVSDNGQIQFGTGDLSIDAGLRDNDSSIIDQGIR